MSRTCPACIDLAWEHGPWSESLPPRCPDHAHIPYPPPPRDPWPRTEPDDRDQQYEIMRAADVAAINRQRGLDNA